MFSVVPISKSLVTIYKIMLAADSTFTLSQEFVHGQPLYINKEVHIREKMACLYIELLI